MRVFHWPEEKPDVGRFITAIDEALDVTEAKYNATDNVLEPLNAWDTGDYEFRGISTKEPCIWIYTDEFMRFLKGKL